MCLLRSIGSQVSIAVCAVMVSIPARVHAVGHPAAEPATEQAAKSGHHMCPRAALVLHFRDGRLSARWTGEHLWIWPDLWRHNDRWWLFGDHWRRHVVDVVRLLVLVMLKMLLVMILMVLVMHRRIHSGLRWVLALVVCWWHWHGHSRLGMRVA